MASREGRRYNRSHFPPELSQEAHAKMLALAHATFSFPPENV
jgi:hypothetical protein